MKKILYFSLCLTPLFADPSMYADNIQKGDKALLDLFGNRLKYKPMNWATIAETDVCAQATCTGDAQVKCYRGFPGEGCQDTQRAFVKDEAERLVGTCEGTSASGNEQSLKRRKTDNDINSVNNGNIGDSTTTDSAGNITQPSVTETPNNAATPTDGAPHGSNALVTDPNNNNIPAGIIAAGVIGAVGVGTLALAQDDDSINIAQNAIPSIIPNINMNVCNTPTALVATSQAIKQAHLNQAAILPLGPVAPNTNNAQTSHNTTYTSIVGELDALSNLVDLSALQGGLATIFGRIQIFNGNGKYAGYFDSTLAQSIVDVTQCIHNLGNIHDISAGIITLANEMR